MRLREMSLPEITACLLAGSCDPKVEILNDPSKSGLKKEIPVESIVDEVTQIICCPRCHSALDCKDGHEGKLFCTNSGCKYFQDGFFEASKQPVLVDFDRSILSKDGFLHRSGRSYLIRNDSRSSTKTRILQFLLGTNDVARACCSKFLVQLKKEDKCPRILVLV